jgi:DNA-binding transcriptional LysR family regulator
MRAAGADAMLIRDIRLRVFHEAAVQQSFTRAAELLSLTQPAVSFHIKSLEEDLGARLFRREKHRVVLTEVGEILLRHAREILALYDRAAADIARVVEHVGGTLTLGVASVIAKYVMPRPIGLFKKRNPQVSIVLEAGNTDSIVAQLARGALDLAIVSDPVDLKGHVTEPLIDDELRLITPPDHGWTGRDAVMLTDVVAEPFILREEGSGTRRILEWYLGQHGIAVSDLNVALTLGSTEAVKAGVEAGAGVSIVSSLSLGDEVRTGAIAIVPIEGVRMARTFSLVYPKLAYRKVVVETFLAFCRERFRASA